MNPLHETTSALEQAIEANRRIQSEIVAKLKHISEAKQKNRQECLQISAALDRHLHRSNEELNNNEAVTNATSDVLKLWKGDDSNRKWKRRFFIDPKKSIPESNADEIQRRKWEGDLASGSYVHRFTPWHKDEVDLLVKYAEEVRKEQQESSQSSQQSGQEGESIAATVKDADIDFTKVAERVQEELSSKKFTQPQKTRILSHSYSLSDGTSKDSHTPRTWIDYRIKFLNSASSSINKNPFTKAESLKIIEFLHKHNHNANPPWHIVAKTLDTSRTPFQCFRHAQTKLSNSLMELANPTTFSQDEDELLFKFIAASGPQFVINHHTATLMAQKFFPHASHFQVIHRANMSLVNPQFVNEKWSEEEERTLVMGMKVYDESDNTPSKASVSLFMMCMFDAAAVFHVAHTIASFPRMHVCMHTYIHTYRHFWTGDQSS